MDVKLIPLPETEMLKVDLKNGEVTLKQTEVNLFLAGFEATVQHTCRPTWRHAEWPNFSEQEVNQPCDEEQHTNIIELRGQ